jgi:hypothetical protein
LHPADCRGSLRVRCSKQEEVFQVIGTYDQVFEVVGQREVQTVVVTMEDRRTNLLVEALLKIKALGLDVVNNCHTT